MRELYGGTGSYRNQVLATWQFANEIKPGDVVFVKKGLKKVVGRGIVEGEYAYDEQRGEFCHTHKVRWTDKGEWEHPDQYVMKTLTDMTPYTVGIVAFPVGRAVSGGVEPISDGSGVYSQHGITGVLGNNPLTIPTLPRISCRMSTWTRSVIKPSKPLC